MPTPTYEWPLTEPLASYVVGPSEPAERVGYKSGEGHAITDLDQAQTLRALRTMFLEQQATMTSRRMEAPLVKDSKSKGFLFMLDALPFEDDHGLLTFDAKP